MGAADILNHLRERGLTLIPEPDGNIRVRPRDKITDADRAEIRANKPALVALLQRQQPTRRPAPIPSINPDVVALCGLDDGEIDLMVQRANAARRAGYSLDDAEVIADRLLMRDRSGLDMTLCLECCRLTGRRCAAARSLGAAPDWQPVRHELRRCAAFTPITKE